ncbi:gamma-glutamylcyclotransferase [Escherichia coli]|nr:gamma-glutamylcyclotransferase [Escherichia coli]
MITRDFLMNADCKTAFGAIEESLLWSAEQRAASLAASGPLGTNAQYLFSLEQELIKLGMQDDGLNELLVSVKKLLAENYPDGVLRPGFA